MNWLSGLGFTSPFVLAGIPLGMAILVYVYRHGGRGMRRVVPTLLLLKKLANQTRARRRFTPPWRFYLEALLLCLLISALAGLYREAPATRVAILLDNSLSMSKASSFVSTTETDWAAAIRETRSYLGSLESTALVELFVSSPSLSPVSEQQESPQLAQARLASIETSYAADHLDAALARLALDSRFDRVVAFTDKQIDASSPGSDSKVRVISVSSGATTSHFENIAVSSVAARGNGNSRGIEVFVANYSDRLVPITVSLSSVETDQERPSYSAVLEKRVIAQKMSRTPVLFENLPQLAHSFEVHIAAEREAQTPFFNAIANDDTAWVTFAPAQLKTLVVSDFTPAELGLGAIDSIRFDGIRPEAYNEKLMQAGQGYRSAIFHRFSPSTLPPVNAAFIVPDNETLFPRDREDAQPEISRWNMTHPILSYLHMPSLLLKQAVTFAPLPWGTELIASTKGPIALSGETGGFRYVAFGFEVLPFEGKKSALSSILFLNTLQYLADTNLNSGFIPVGSSLTVSGSGALRVQGTTLEVLPAKDKAVTALRPGIYQIVSDSGPQHVAVNFFDDQESNTFDTQIVHRPASTSSDSTRSRFRPLAEALATLCLILLLIDLAIFASLSKPSRNSP